MSRRTKLLLLILLGIGFVVFPVGGILLFGGRSAYTRLEKLLFSQPVSTGTSSPPTQIVVTQPEPSQPIPIPSPTATQTPTPRCGGPPVMVLALLGIDSRADSYQAGLADSIRLVRVDFINPGIMVLPFQRDLYVEIPGIAEHGITHGKLNQGYTYGTPAFGYYDAPNQGLGLMQLTMQHNFGARVDFGIAINMKSFTRIVDALGGLDVNLPYAIDGRVPRSRDPALYFPAGAQHLDGFRTLMLARVRPQGDFERTNIQTLILQALSAKLLSPAVFSTLPELVSSFQDSVYTDLGAAEIAQLTCLAIRLDPPKIVYVNFPQDLFEGTRVQDPVLGNTFIYAADFDILRRYVAAFLEGSWPGEGLRTPAPVP